MGTSDAQTGEWAYFRVVDVEKFHAIVIERIRNVGVRRRSRETGEHENVAGKRHRAVGDSHSS